MSDLVKTLKRLSSPRDFGEEFVLSFEKAVKRLNPPRERKPNYKPSMISSCLRHIVFMFIQAPQDPVSVNPYWKLIAESGSADHEIIQSILWQMEPEGVEMVNVEDHLRSLRRLGVDIEIKKSTKFETHFIDKRYNISGMTDGLFRFKKKLVLLEIKNEDHFKWMKRTSPKTEHIEQASCYSLSLFVNYILFLYFNRNTKKIKPYLVEITDEQRNWVVNRITTCNQYLEKGLLPDREKDRCMYCSYTKVCKEIGPGEHPISDYL